jgi:Pyridoxamine 5'-phosphate oxidase
VADRWVPVSDPVAQPSTMPADYGAVGPKRLPWSWATERLGPAMVYWLATVRPDGSPRARPVDGTWVDNALFVGGSPKAGWIRDLSNDGRVSVHLPDVRGVVIVEGMARQVIPDEGLAERLAAAARKYEAMYGESTASSYLGKPVWAIRPDLALGWERFPTDATRWEFERPRRDET